MKILLDGMGGDNAPEIIVKGALAALPDISEELCIIGNKHVIQKLLTKYGYVDNGQDCKITVVHAEEVIENHEAPVRAIRKKKNSSIVLGLNMLKSGEGDVFISAGSTGALLAGGLLLLGRISGIERPALATVYPIIGGKPSLLLDAGANSECKPNHLLNFAAMGSIYMEKVIGRNNPSIGLVNNGAEKGKGSSLTKETYQLLENANLNFIGNLEARDVPLGYADIILTDGFTGNVMLKLSEGLALTIMGELKKQFTSGTIAKIGASLLKNKLMDLKTSLDYKEYGGAPVLGVKGAMLKMHGSSDAIAVKQTILKSIPFVEGNVVQIIEDSADELEAIISNA